MSLTLAIEIFFQGMSPLARETKAKLSYLDYTKVKMFYTAKESVHKEKGNLLNGRIYLTKHMQ